MLPLVNGLLTRGITSETCKRYRYFSTGVPGESVAQFPHGYKFRKGGWQSGAKQTWWQPGSKRDLFGIHLLDPAYVGDVYLCEGETDAMALSQIVDAPVLALAGEPTAELWGEWLALIAGHCWEHTLYLAFDNDEKGQAYTDYVLDHIKTPTMGVMWGEGDKDVAQALMNGKALAWEPLPKLPPYLFTGETLIARRKQVKPIEGLTTGFSQLDQLAGKWKPGFILGLTGGAKNGKTSFVLELSQRFISNHRQPVLFMPLEMTLDETLPALAASSLGVDVHSTPPEILNAEADRLAPYLMVLEHFGSLPASEMEHVIGSAAKLGAKLVVLDHINAATSTSDNSTAMIDDMLYRFKAIVNRYAMSGIVVSHMNGEDTDLATLGSLRGSRALGQVASCTLGIKAISTGISELYTVTRSRDTGRTGSIRLEFIDNRFEELHTRQGKLL